MLDAGGWPNALNRPVVITVWQRRMSHLEYVFRHTLIDRQSSCLLQLHHPPFAYFTENVLKSVKIAYSNDSLTEIVLYLMEWYFPCLRTCSDQSRYAIWDWPGGPGLATAVVL